MIQLKYHDDGDEKNNSNFDVHAKLNSQGKITESAPIQNKNTNKHAGKANKQHKR
jgi:hypothetical protein